MAVGVRSVTWCVYSPVCTKREVKVREVQRIEGSIPTDDNNFYKSLNLGASSTLGGAQVIWFGNFVVRGAVDICQDYHEAKYQLPNARIDGETTN
jgi:hypothetical protein